jgi:hypothetical protein
MQYKIGGQMFESRFSMMSLAANVLVLYGEFLSQKKNWSIL